MTQQKEETEAVTPEDARAAAETPPPPSAAVMPAPALCFRHIQDPASQRLTWNKPPVNVLVIRKIRDESLVEPFKQLCRFLVEVRRNPGRFCWSS